MPDRNYYRSGYNAGISCGHDRECACDSGDNAGSDVRLLQRHDMAGHVTPEAVFVRRPVVEREVDAPGEQVRCEGFYESDDDYDEN